MRQRVWGHSILVSALLKLYAALSPLLLEQEAPLTPGPEKKHPPHHPSCFALVLSIEEGSVS